MDNGTTPEINTAPQSPILPPSQPVSPQKSNFIKSKKWLIIIFSVSFLILIGGISAWLLLSSQKKPITPQQNNNLNQGNQSQDVKTYPKFQFTYQTPPPLSNPKTQLPTYTLKTSFNESELATFGAKFGFPKVEKVEEGLASYSDFTNPESRGYLVFDTSTGAFEYTNMAQSTKIQGADIKTGAKNFLESIGFSDGLISCDITYNNTVAPDMTYVECHRSWDALGVPLLNLPGVMNISSETPLSTLRLGYSDTPLENPLITNVSTGQDGISRPNDFNTATFALAKDGTILSLMSNLRWIESANQNTIKPPTDAINEFKEHKATETVALPIDRNFDWDKVFSSTTSTGNDAQITDYELIYVENESGQKQETYSPMYLIRGNVMLSSGYRVNFVQIVPAASKTLSSIPIAQNSQLQLQTFQQTPTPSVTRGPTTTTKPNNPRPTPKPFDCSLDESIVRNNGLGGRDIYGDRLVRHTVRINGANVQLATLEEAPNTFFINEKVTTLEQVASFRGEVFKLIAQQLAWNYKNGAQPDSPSFEGFPSGYGPTAQAKGAVEGMYSALINSSAPLENPQFPISSVTVLSLHPGFANSPCYLTGLSPTIFLYSQAPQEFSIQPSFAVHTDPYTTIAWKVLTNKTGELTLKDTTTNYLYYEFNPAKVAFNKQEKGFVLAINDIQSFTPKLAKLMNLNPKESERLLFELELAANDLPEDTQYIKISLIPSNELNTKLPLKVSPKPEHTNRYHFVLSKAQKNVETNNPIILPVKRGKSTLVEIGASAQR